MALYLVLLKHETPLAITVIRDEFPDSHYSVANGQWLVVSDETAKLVSASLKERDDSFPSHVVVPFENYWGWHDSDLWSWAKLKRGEDD